MDRVEVFLALCASGVGEKYLHTFEIGLIQLSALSATPDGKSEFLDQDLIPAAQKSCLLLRTSIYGMRVNILPAP